jgi:hypothetical protein
MKLKDGINSGYHDLLGAIYESAMLDYVDEILNKKAGVETHKQNFLPGGKFIQKNPYGMSDGTLNTFSRNRKFGVRY